MVPYCVCCNKNISHLDKKYIKDLRVLQTLIHLFLSGLNQFVQKWKISGQKLLRQFHCSYQKYKIILNSN